MVRTKTEQQKAYELDEYGVERATRQAKYKALTSSYQAAGGRDQQLASSTPRIGQSDCQGTIHVTGRNMWSSGKAKYSDMVAQ
jgi:hypothetical protein